MALTEAQLHALLGIIDKHHNAFIANFVGPSTLPPSVLANLEAAGLVEPKVQGVRDAFLFGMLSANLPRGGGNTPSYAQLADRIARNPFPLSEAERQAISVAQITAGQFISGLGAKVKIQAGQRVMQATPQSKRDDTVAYRKVISEGIAERKRVGSIVSDLGHATGDFCRDLERVANTELSNAMQQGTAAQAKKTFGDDVRVAKIALASCCPLCDKLLRMPDGKPKIFMLSELEANGTNYGRKAKDALAVVGAQHPNCSCRIVVVPEGTEFDKRNLLVPVKGAAGKPQS